MFNIRISDDFIWQTEYESALSLAFIFNAIELYWDSVWYKENGI